MHNASIEDDCHREGEASPALVCIHPEEKSVAVAVGFELRVFDLVAGNAIAFPSDVEEHLHSDSIRAICFSADGKLFASAGDDKLVKIWKVDTWKCIRTVCSDKRVSAIAISPNGSFCCFADKFGVVWVINLDDEVENQASVGKKASPLLGHYCSIITSLIFSSSICVLSVNPSQIKCSFAVDSGALDYKEFSPDGSFIASADRDFKIRITAFPKAPQGGAHEIQSFCLGHTDFVSCIVFLHPPNCPQGFLLSGGGDSTVRLWDFLSGSLLDTCDIVAQLTCTEYNESAKEDYSVITNLCTSPDGSVIAASIQSLHGVVLLSCNIHAKTLGVAKVISVGENFIPTSLGISNLANHLWLAMGASLPSSGRAMTPVRVKVIAGFKESGSPSALEDPKVPGGVELLETLQGSLGAETNEQSFASTTEALKLSMRNLLIKKQYSVEKRELRKKTRNDRKSKQ